MSQEAQRRRGHQENARRRPAERRAQEPRHGAGEERLPTQQRQGPGQQHDENKKHDGHGTSPTKTTKTIKIAMPREGAKHQPYQES